MSWFQRRSSAPRSPIPEPAAPADAGPATSIPRPAAVESNQRSMAAATADEPRAEPARDVGLTALSAANFADDPAAPRSPAVIDRPRRRRRRTARRGPPVGKVFGALTIGSVLAAMNWRGDATASSPLRYAEMPTPDGEGSQERRVLGALRLGQFLAGVNWKNAHKGPKLEILSGAETDAARCVLETFMNEINWD